MSKRAGKTEKVSISVDRDDLKILRKLADRLHGGNFSALLHGLAEDERRFQAMGRLIDKIGGPPISDADRAAVEAEWFAPLRVVPAKKKRTRAA